MLSYVCIMNRFQYVIYKFTEDKSIVKKKYAIVSYSQYDVYVYLFKFIGLPRTYLLIK